MSDTILLVEDDHEVRSLVRMLLEYEGFQVREAATGDQAVERSAREPVDLILLDLRLPGDTRSSPSVKTYSGSPYATSLPRSTSSTR